ncbi:Hypothetical protein SRAE_2000136600 [Strongyloides ratti]|uniref:Uncharacterized protein n=1 Tax=Strongyloides ratti TaxID=34506 RepID=A0A090MY76_STRRB|nr:Hypothetical protein SRAE_2000136600 [Strongyloides ratti]CEF66699.1 Hypothetical protein SRAE_2000136600 [Strongyloides ratti]
MFSEDFLNDIESQFQDIKKMIEQYLELYKNMLEQLNQVQKKINELKFVVDSVTALRTQQALQAGPQGPPGTPVQLRPVFIENKTVIIELKSDKKLAGPIGPPGTRVKLRNITKDEL